MRHTLNSPHTEQIYHVIDPFVAMLPYGDLFVDQVERFRKMVDDIVEYVYSLIRDRWYTTRTIRFARVYIARVYCRHRRGNNNNNNFVTIASMIMTMTTTTTLFDSVTDWTKFWLAMCLTVCVGNWQYFVFAGSWQRSINVALANSGVGSATVSARGRTNGAAAWPSRRNDCRPSSICTVCTIGRDAPYRRPCGTSSSRRESVGATMASFPWTPSAGPCSVGTPEMASVTTLYAWSVYPVHGKTRGYVKNIILRLWDHFLF